MSGDSEKATVLVVEDSSVNRLALAKGVEREGHSVMQAENGRQALAVLADEQVDMVLLDLLMPEVDGFAVLDAMARDADLRAIPVLVISAVEATEDIARAIDMGAIDCLPKPFDPVILSVRLRTALEQARLRRVEQDYLRQELALQQQERLATLGRLSAGLGHELNNPAAAALSSARRLGDSLRAADAVLARLVERPDPHHLIHAFSDIAAADPLTLSATEREDRAAALVAVLERHGVSDPWGAADALAAAGITAGQADSVLSGLRDRESTSPAARSDAMAADDAVAWFTTRASLAAAARQITETVGRIAELITALRGYSYMDRAPQQDVDVREGLDDTLMILAHKVPDAVTVERDFADDLPRITAYGGQLNQVWTNLLDNAIAAVGDTGHLTIRTWPTADGIAVEVIDDGQGIPADLQRRVFEPFVTTKPPGQGTGLGLNIAHQIVTEVHGGRLTVRSQPGQTAFTVELPLRSTTEEA